jgi:hypothetical protein
MDNTFAYADAFAQAFNIEMASYNATTTTTPKPDKPNLSPIHTTLNPYAKKQNIFSFSREFTSQEL